MTAIPWNDEARKSFASIITLTGHRWKTWRRMRRWNGVCAVLYPSWAALCAWYGNYVPALVMIVCCWLMYRLYRSARKWEWYWKSLHHHAQRSVVEDFDRAGFHLEQLKYQLDHYEEQTR